MKKKNLHQLLDEKMVFFPLTSVRWTLAFHPKPRSVCVNKQRTNLENVANAKLRKRFRLVLARASKPALQLPRPIVPNWTNPIANPAKLRRLLRVRML